MAVQLAAAGSGIDNEPQLIRSYLLLNSDRYILEQDYMESLMAGSGPFGTGLVDLEALKRRHL